MHHQKIYKVLKKLERWEKKNSSSILGRNVYWYSNYGEQYEVPQKQKIELMYDPAIPLMGIYSEIIIQK